MKSARKLSVVAGIAVLGLSILSGQAQACSQDGQEGFVPRNNRYIPVRRVVLDSNGNPSGGGITKEEFNAIITAVDKVYNPIVKEMGGNLVFNRNWEDGTVNAYADRSDGNWNVSMFGGLARHKETTIDGFLLVVCHELGHHIGGAPKYGSFATNEWASDEGQSDYFATLKCARRVLQNEKNLRALPALNAPDEVRVACRETFAIDNEAAICIRGSMGGLSLARLLADLGGANSESEMPLFTTPDQSKVSETDHSHPAAQCRLDTYFNGATCEVDFKTDVDQTDPVIGTCAQEKGATAGFRPRCWYAPKSDNTAPDVPSPDSPQRGVFY